MPTVLRIGPYRFHFYSSDGGEPRHIHVSRDGADAKFWLEPGIQNARNRGFTSTEIRAIQKLIEDHQETLRNAWDDVFNP